MWYYEIAHQPQGPVGAETIQQLLAAGTINAATLVWRAGMPNWKPLQQTELAEIWQKVLPDMSLTAVAYAKPNRPVKSSALKKLFVWWLVLESIGLVYVAINYFLPNASIKTTISCIIELPMIASVVLQFVLLFQFWKIVQDGFAPTTPAKAVGFLFIPIFNLY